MTAEEKAKELCKKFENSLGDLEVDSEPGGGGWIDSFSKRQVSKQCALIVVSEIMEFMEKDDLKHDDCSWANSQEIEYWLTVKDHINKPKP